MGSGEEKRERERVREESLSKPSFAIKRFLGYIYIYLPMCM